LVHASKRVVGAAAVVFCGFGVVVVGALVIAALNLKRIAYTIIVGVLQACTIAVIMLFSILTISLIGGISHIVAGLVVGASLDLQLVANAIVV
jgi:hypothetical protein